MNISQSIYRRRSILYSVSAVLFWSTVATAFKLALEGLSYAQLLFYSSLSSTIVLFFILLLSGRKKRILPELKGRYMLNSMFLGFLNPFLYYMVLFKAYSLLPAYEAQPLNYTWPIIISLMSAFFLKERLGFRTVLGLLTAFIGVVIIATRGEIFSLKFQDPEGVILAVGSSLIWGSYWILNVMDKREAPPKLFGAFFMGTIYSALYLLFFGSFSVKSSLYIAGAAYVGVFEMGVTFFLWMKGLALSKNKARTSTLAYLSPFISLIFITLILNEKISVYSVIGLMLIIGGIIYQQADKKLPKSERVPANR
ncbi:MAG: EamA family transporter [Ignavibacteria bacterium]|jgi:drug/metabolite transporter (DMT)-like permease|nr:EamA family transporter [Ignavibacteria bacterium]MCU7501893.1 EamA family transporter [Ignavibacteria bacterium]MCU7514761.1 EamA family transporter [Ignavibacteria bacterium]